MILIVLSVDSAIPCWASWIVALEEQPSCSFADGEFFCPNNVEV